MAAQGWGIPVLPSHPPTFSPFWPRVSFRVWVDPVYCLYLSPPPWPRGPQRGAWTHLSLRGPLSGWGDICKGSRAVEGISQDYDGLEGEGLSHRTHQCPPLPMPHLHLCSSSTGIANTCYSPCTVSCAFHVFVHQVSISDIIAMSVSCLP